MLRRLSLTASIACAISLLSAAVAFAAPQRAPAPAKPVDLERFYSGTWLEIGRLPMRLTDGCVAGATTYTRVSATRVKVVDTCQEGTPDGKTKSISGNGTIQDPGTNAILKVRYALVIVWEYQVLDRADDYSWFISSDPEFEKVWIYTREVPSAEQLAALKDRVRALGYDPDRLEYPAPLRR